MAGYQDSRISGKRIEDRISELVIRELENWKEKGKGKGKKGKRILHWRTFGIQFSTGEPSVSNKECPILHRRTFGVEVQN